MRIGNDSLIEGPVDFTVPWTSGAIWCGHVNNFSLSLFFEGAPEGILQLECSNDKGSNEAQSSEGVNNWSVIEGSAQLIDEAGDHTWAVDAVSWRWTRVRWIPSAGSGTLVSARFNVKGF